MTLHERHADALSRAMALSRQRQDLAAQLAQCDAELLKTAGAIDLLDILIKESEAAGG